MVLYPFSYRCGKRAVEPAEQEKSTDVSKCDPEPSKMGETVRNTGACTRSFGKRSGKRMTPAVQEWVSGWNAEGGCVSNSCFQLKCKRQRDASSVENSKTIAP